MSQQTWGEFREQAFGDPYMVWHDGPDFFTMREHWERDPVLVEGMLRQGLAEGDGLAAQSLRELPLPAASRDAFVLTLKAALPAARGTLRVRIAEALRTLTGSESWSRDIPPVLFEPGHWGSRIDAAMALAAVAPAADLIEAVQHGGDDPEYLVRFHCANTLLRWAGDSSDISSHADWFDALTAEEAPQRWATLFAQLAAAASARLTGGAGGNV